MCGRFALAIPRTAILERFELEAVPEAPDRYNIAPGQPVEAVVQDVLGRRMALFTWGFVPAFAKGRPGATLLVNARAETAAEKPAFRQAMRTGRALVPAQGFYEWSGRAGQRQAWFFTADAQDRGARPLLALAALYAPHHDPHTQTEGSLALLTCSANGLVAPVHHRMPVVVRPEDDARWLDPELTDTQALADLLAPRPWPDMTAWRVGPAINSARNQGPSLIEQIGGQAQVEIVFKR